MSAVKTHLARVDGVMIGREAYQNPYLLAGIEEAVFAASSVPDRETVLIRFADYAEAQERLGVPARRLVRHLSRTAWRAPMAPPPQRNRSRRDPGANFDRIIIAFAESGPRSGTNPRLHRLTSLQRPRNAH